MYESASRDNSVKNLEIALVVICYIGYSLNLFEIEILWITPILAILILVILMMISFRTIRSIGQHIRNRTIKKKSLGYIKKLPFLFILLMPSDLIAEEMERLSKLDVILILVILGLWMISRKRRNVYKKI